MQYAAREGQRAVENDINHSSFEQPITAEPIFGHRNYFGLVSLPVIGATELAEGCMNVAAGGSQRGSWRVRPAIEFDSPVAVERRSILE